jgi:hypothetical protein
VVRCVESRRLRRGSCTPEAEVGGVSNVEGAPGSAVSVENVSSVRGVRCRIRTSIDGGRKRVIRKVVEKA